MVTKKKRDDNSVVPVHGYAGVRKVSRKGSWSITASLKSYFRGRRAYGGCTGHAPASAMFQPKQQMTRALHAPIYPQSHITGRRLIIRRTMPSEEGLQRARSARAMWRFLTFFFSFSFYSLFEDPRAPVLLSPKSTLLWKRISRKSARARARFFSEQITGRLMPASCGYRTNEHCCSCFFSSLCVRPFVMSCNSI